MSDLVKRLRKHLPIGVSVTDEGYYWPGPIMSEAADRIEELERKNAYQDEVIEQRNAECSRQFKRIETLEAENERLRKAEVKDYD